MRDKGIEETIERLVSEAQKMTDLKRDNKLYVSIAEFGILLRMSHFDSIKESRVIKINQESIGRQFVHEICYKGYIFQAVTTRKINFREYL